jgi:tRNA A-37 threonylcarbamoyl transferase component Bud32
MTSNLWNLAIINDSFKSQPYVNVTDRAENIIRIIRITEKIIIPKRIIHLYVKLLDILFINYSLDEGKFELLSASIISLLDAYMNNKLYDEDDWVRWFNMNFTKEELQSAQILILNLLDCKLYYDTYFELLENEMNEKKYSHHKIMLAGIIADYLLLFNMINNINPYLVKEIILSIVNQSKPATLTEEHKYIYLILKSISSEDKQNVIYMKLISYGFAPTLINYLSEFSFDDVKLNAEIPEYLFIDGSESLSINEIKYMKMIGRGVSSNVYEGKYKNKSVAIKKYKNSSITSDFVREVTALKKLSGGYYSVGYYGMAKHIIIMEMAKESLHQWIYENYDEKQISAFIVHIIKGLYIIHSNGIIHRDLKPLNILLSGGVPRIADFGLSTCVNFNQNDKISDYTVATIYYRSPEIIESCSCRHKALDIWSLGCIIYEMINRSVLFNKTNANEQYELILEIVKNKNFKSHLHNSLSRILSPKQCDIVYEMFNLNYHERITIKEINDAWLSNVS